MKCRTFKIDLSGEANGYAEVQFNKFLEKVSVRQTFAEIVGGEYWSILVFYEDANSTAHGSENDSPRNIAESKIQRTKSPVEKPAAESPVLTPQKERKFTALKNWRNQRAATDGVPPYLIAPNDSLTQIAAAEKIETVEDLTNIKGFGEKRAQKYGEEILRVLSE